MWCFTFAKTQKSSFDCLCLIHYAVKTEWQPPFSKIKLVFSYLISSRRVNQLSLPGGRQSVSKQSLISSVNCDLFQIGADFVTVVTDRSALISVTQLNCFYSYTKSQLVIYQLIIHKIAVLNRLPTWTHLQTDSVWQQFYRQLDAPKSHWWQQLTVNSRRPCHELGNEDSNADSLGIHNKKQTFI